MLPHSQRLSMATILLTIGVNAKIVQEILGHANISMTLGIYGQVLPSMQRDAMDGMDDIWGGKKARPLEKYVTLPNSHRSSHSRKNKRIISCKYSYVLLYCIMYSYECYLIYKHVGKRASKMVEPITLIATGIIAKHGPDWLHSLQETLLGKGKEYVLEQGKERWHAYRDERQQVRQLVLALENAAERGSRNFEGEERDCYRSILEV